MTAAWLVSALVSGSLIALAAGALDGVARARGWPTRWVWAGAMLSTLVLIASSAWRTSEPVPVGAVALPSIAASTDVAAASSPIVRVAAVIRAAVESEWIAGVLVITRWLPSWMGPVAAALWTLGVLAGLAVLVLVHARLRRARRGWPAAELHGHRVRVAPTVGPAVVGLAHPEIVVPQWLLERATGEQRLVLAHEEEHVRAGDHLLLGAACLVVALMPWHPALWWSLARLRLALELDCDARVLRRGARARAYGEMLIDLAGQCSGFRVGATALADKTSHLERRLLAMRPNTQRFTPIRVAALSATAALAFVAACEARVPTSTEIQSMDVAKAERAAGSVGLMTQLHGGTLPEFYVNDVKVSAEDAHAIPANDIATVNIEKKSTGDGNVIRIRTVASTRDGMKYRGAAPAGTVQPGEAMLGLHEKLRSTMMPASHEFSGVILINGVRSDAAALHKLDPRTIAGVEVLKGEAASAISSDPAAKNGIIKVTLR